MLKLVPCSEETEEDSNVTAPLGSDKHPTLLRTAFQELKIEKECDDIRQAMNRYHPPPVDQHPPDLVKKESSAWGQWWQSFSLWSPPEEKQVLMMGELEKGSYYGSVNSEKDEKKGGFKMHSSTDDSGSNYGSKP